MPDDAVLDAPVAAEPVADISTADIETSAVESTPEVDAAEPKVGDAAEPTEKPAAEVKPAEDSTKSDTTGTLAKLNAHLKTVEDPGTRKELRSALTDGLRYKALVDGVGGAKDLAELREKLSGGDESARSQLEAVKATDELLYSGDSESHRELADNIRTDLQNQDADTANATFASLTSHLLANMKENDPEGYVAHQRDEFLTTSESVKLIESINSLSELLHSGDVAGAKKLLGNVIGFFRDEIAAEGAAKPKAAVAAGAEKVSPAVEALRKETGQLVHNAENKELGSHLGKLFSSSLKSLTQTQRKAVADEIKKSIRTTLGSDKEYVADMGPRFDKMRGKSAQTELMKIYSNKLKGEWGKNLVNSIANKMHPSLMAPKAAPVAPKPVVPSKQEKIGGADQKVYMTKTKPTLVREDIVHNGRMYTSGELELLMISGVGLHVNPDKKNNPTGKAVWVRWNR
jgi:hypothetical protein